MSCNSEKSNTDTPSLTDTLPTNFDQLKQTALNHIGELAVGMPMKSVIEKLGQPASISKTEVWGADGLSHQDWEYPSKGVSLNMVSLDKATAFEIFSITISSPCTFKTNKNIGIGNSYQEVTAAYEKEIDNTASDDNIITVGSLYGGIIIEFKEKKVVSLFVGAAAE